MTADDPAAQRLDIALAAARMGGDVSLEHFPGSPAAAAWTPETKPDGSVVTLADRAAETRMVEIIRGTFPDDAILGEEHGEMPGTSGWRWILDPIDGTRSFVQGVPLYGTLVAAAEGDAIRLGVIHMPALGETVWARLGGGAWHAIRGGEPRPARVSSVDRLDEATANATSIEYFAQGELQPAYLAIAEAAGCLRGWSDCYGYLLLATGRVDVVAEPLVHAWDVAPCYPILAEAGGRCTDWHGRGDAFSGTNLATNGRLHEAMLDLLAGHVAASGV